MDAIFAVSLTHKSKNTYRRERQDLAKGECFASHDMFYMSLL